MSLTEKNGLKISSKLFDFINNEVIPGTNIKTDEFWESFASNVNELAPINKSLIEKREDIQKKIDELHKDLVSSKLRQKNSLNHIPEIKFTNNFKVSNIQFIYPDTKPLILDKINFTIKKGDFVALTGKSGEGK